ESALRGLPRAKIVQLCVDAVLGRLTHHARVEHGHLRALEVRLHVTGFEQAPGKGLRVGDVHLASGRPDMESSVLQRVSTRSRIPVRSSPSIEMSMKDGMQTSSSPPGAT